MALAGLVFAGGIAGGAFILSSTGDEEEIAQQVQTSTPVNTISPAVSAPAATSSTGAGDLPPASRGYEWHMTPKMAHSTTGFPYTLYKYQARTSGPQRALIMGTRSNSSLGRRLLTRLASSFESHQPAP